MTVNEKKKGIQIQCSNPIFGFYIGTVRFESSDNLFRNERTHPSDEFEFRDDLERWIQIGRYIFKTQKLSYFRRS